MIRLTLVRRLLALVRARRLERELEGEVSAHLELAERDGIAAGLSPEEARRAARRSFGSIESMKESHRDERSVRWIDTFVRDVRYGVLLLLRDRGFSAIAIGVMAIGIGANAAMFSLVDAVLLKPLPYPDPDRIVRVLEMPTPTTRNGITTLNLLDWKRLSTSFEALSATRGLSVALTGAGEPSRLNGTLVSADYFKVFGVEAAMGRTFLPKDEEPGAAPVVVLSHAVWQDRFGGRPRHPRSPDRARRRIAPGGRRAAARQLRPRELRASGSRCSSRPSSGPATITGSARSAG